jgi:hypothetical protein
VLDGGRARKRRAELFAPAVAAKDHDALAAHDGELRQREHSLAVVGRRGNARAGDAGGGERLRGSRARRHGDEPRRPSRRIGHAAFDGISGNEDRVVVVPERRLRACDGAGSLGGRITIAGKMTGVPPSAAILRAMPPACRAGRVTGMPRPSGPRPGGSDGGSVKRMPMAQV